MYSVDVPRSTDDFPAPLNMLDIAANIFMRLATPLATRPNVISSTGPIPATTVVAITAKFLASSLIELNLSRNCLANSITGVMAFRNASPRGTRDTLISSTAFLNLYIGESSTRFNSRSARIASSSEELLVN